MKKKIVKRSLLLGALMAFVITGNVLAGELAIDNQDKYNDWKDNGIVGWSDAGSVAIFNNANVVGNELSVDYNGSFNGLQAIFGGYNRILGSEDVIGNNLVIKNGIFEGHYQEFHGGASNYDNDVKNNVVTINGGKFVNNYSYIYGGQTYKGDTLNNSAIFNGGDYENKSTVIYGGYTKNGDALNNSIIVNGGIFKTAITGSFAGYSENGNANNNRYDINGGVFEKDVALFGSGAVNGNANNNEINIRGGQFKGEVSINVGNSKGANKEITNNRVVITNNGSVVPEFLGDVEIWAAYSDFSTVKNNEVIINAGVFDGDTVILASRTTNNNIPVEDNSVSIKNTIFNGNTTIYGSNSVYAPMNNNKVTIGEGATFNGSAEIYGANRVGVGNILNITDGWSGKVTTIKNFNTININDDSTIVVTGSVELPKGATLNLADGNDYTGENYAITGKLTTNETATLTIGNIKATTYNIATDYTDNGTAWTVDILNDELLLLDKINIDGQLQVTVKAQESKNIADNLNVSEGTADVIAGIVTNAAGVEEGSAGAAAVGFINNVMSNAEDKGTAINSAMKMAEHVGISANAAKIMTNVGNITNDRLSFTCGHSAPNKGGFGVGLFEEGSGADIWAEYVHGKDKVEDMPSTAGATSYEGQFNGIVMGVDFKKVNKFQSGVAFNYGEGDTNSVGNVARTRNDYDFWGVGYYGNIYNDDSNVIFDVNYAKTDSDVTQNNSGTVFEASPETTTWSAGVKLEKLYQNENVQIVPYTGLRYMSIDSDDYSTKCGAFNYSMDRQDIWLLPLGVSIRQEIANDNGWTVSPRVDLSYIWAFGDTNSNMEVKSPFSGVSQLGYDVMDDGSFLGLVGIEAHKGQWGYGVSYSYQKGDHSESKKWFVDVNYSF